MKVNKVITQQERLEDIEIMIFQCIETALDLLEKALDLIEQERKLSATLGGR